MSYSNKMKIEVDPRILANQQKIIQFLNRIGEEQTKQKEYIKMLMKENKHFHSDVYSNFKVLEREVTSLQEGLDVVQGCVDSMNRKTKSIHKHVNGLRSNLQNAGVSDSDSHNQLISPHRMGTSSLYKGKTPRKHNTAPQIRVPRDSYSPCSYDENNSDSDHEELPALPYSDPNILHNVSPIQRSSQTKRLSPFTNTSRSFEVPQQEAFDNGSLPGTSKRNIGFNGSGNVSPVPMQNLPPPNVRKPGTKRAREPVGNGFSDFNNVKKGTLPGRRLVSGQPQLADFRKLMTDFGMELNSNTIAAVTRANYGNNMMVSRTVGLHTVLILDTSASMEGQPFNTLKKFVDKMLDSIDIAAGEPGLEEHIAIVTCGETPTIKQPFSNDYLQIRQIVGTARLENLPIKGRTPLMTALVLSFCYLEMQGECVDMHEHLITPRVIVISDFQATSDKQFEGYDTETSHDRIEIQRQIFDMSRRFKTRYYPVYCVPVGESNNKVANEIAENSGGEVIVQTSPDVAGNYYRYQTVVGNVLRLYNLGLEEGQDVDVQQLIGQTLPRAGFSQEHKEYVESLLGKALTANLCGMDDLDLMDEDDVTRGGSAPQSDAAHSRQQQTSPQQRQMSPHQHQAPPNHHQTPPRQYQAPPQQQQAPLQQYHTPPNHHQTPTRQYQAPPQQQQAPPQQKKTPPQQYQASSHQPESQLVDQAELPELPEWNHTGVLESISLEERGDLPSIGTRVKRGPDWKWGTEDGDGPGTIVGHKDPGLVYMLWDNTGMVGVYRHGYNGKENDVVKEFTPRHVKPGEIEIGCCVMRGSDWNRGDEDGGTGTVGVVVRKLQDRHVQVRWPSRIVDTYKFGADNKWDLEVTLDPPHSAGAHAPAQGTSNAENEATGHDRPQVPGEEATEVAWKWKDQAEQWRLFSDGSNRKLESNYQRDKNGQVMVQINNKNVKVFLKEMSCTVNDLKRPIQREMLSPQEIKDLQEIEKML